MAAILASGSDSESLLEAAFITRLGFTVAREAAAAAAEWSWNVPGAQPPATSFFHKLYSSTTYNGKYMHVFSLFLKKSTFLDLKVYRNLWTHLL